MGRQDGVASPLGPYGVIRRSVFPALAGDTTAQALYALMTTYGGREIWPHQQTLADLMGVSVDTVRRGIERLESVGAIEIHPRLSQGRKVGNSYFLALDGTGMAATSVGPDGTGTGAGSTKPHQRGFVEQTNEQTSTTRAPKKKRGRDDLWDAVARACLLPLDSALLTASARGMLVKATNEIRKVGGTPDGVAVRAEEYHRRFRGASLTPTALAKHWPSLDTGADDGDPGPSETDLLRRVR